MDPEIDEDRQVPRVGTEAERFHSAFYYIVPAEACVVSWHDWCYADLVERQQQAADSGEAVEYSPNHPRAFLQCTVLREGDGACTATRLETLQVTTNGRSSQP